MSGYDSRQVEREARERRDAEERRAARSAGTRAALPPELEGQVARRLWGAYVQAVRDWLTAAEEGPRRGSEAAPWVRLIGPEVCAGAALSAVAGGLFSRPGLTALAGQVGQLLRDELVWQRCRELSPTQATKTARNPARAGGLRKRLPLLARSLGLRTNFPVRDRMRVGVTLLELLRQSTGAVEFVRAPHPDRKLGWRMMTVVVPAPALEGAMAQLMADPRVRAAHGPMVAPPLEWTGTRGGGRHTYPDRALVKRGRRGGSVPQSMIDAANQLQEVAWRVNPDVYWTLRRAWEETARPIGKVPMRDDLPMPEYREDLASRTQGAMIRHQNRVASSQRLAVLYALRSCEQLVADGGTTLWYPVQFDYRGRVYYDVSYLSPQGNDLERALLRFDGPLRRLTPDAERSLLIHAANLAGHDKRTFDERVAWSRAQAGDWAAVAADPIGNLPLWEGADEPWQYLAAILAHARGDDGGLPIYADGTCNGLQVFSLLLRDRETAARVNVTPGDRPRDVYAEVAAATATILETSPEGRRLNEWLGGTLPRAMVKRTVMTLPYGVRPETARIYLHEPLEEKIREGRRWPGTAEEFKASTRALGEAVWAAVWNTLPAAMRCREWLEQTARAVGQEFYWTTPLGFRVWNSQHRSKRNHLVTSVHGRRLDVYVREFTDKVDRRKQVTVMSPNFVHSLDAACLHLAALRARAEGHDWSGIHDCVGTRAESYDAVGKIVRGAYADVFSENLLEGLARQLRDRYSVTVPEPPPLGDLDPSEVKTSPYFFN